MHKKNKCLREKIEVNTLFFGGSIQTHFLLLKLIYQSHNIPQHSSSKVSWHPEDRKSSTIFTALYQKTGLGSKTRESAHKTITHSYIAYNNLHLHSVFPEPT